MFYRCKDIGKNAQNYQNSSTVNTEVLFKKATLKSSQNSQENTSHEVPFFGNVLVSELLEKLIQKPISGKLFLCTFWKQKI